MEVSRGGAISTFAISTAPISARIFVSVTPTPTPTFVPGGGDPPWQVRKLLRKKKLRQQLGLSPLPEKKQAIVKKAEKAPEPPLFDYDLPPVERRADYQRLVDKLKRELAPAKAKVLPPEPIEPEPEPLDPVPEWARDLDATPKLDLLPDTEERPDYEALRRALEQPPLPEPEIVVPEPRFDQGPPQDFAQDAQDMRDILDLVSMARDPARDLAAHLARDAQDLNDIGDLLALIPSPEAIAAQDARDLADIVSLLSLTQ